MGIQHKLEEEYKKAWEEGKLEEWVDGICNEYPFQWNEKITFKPLKEIVDVMGLERVAELTGVWPKSIDNMIQNFDGVMDLGKENPDCINEDGSIEHKVELAFWDGSKICVYAAGTEEEIAQKFEGKYHRVRGDQDIRKCRKATVLKAEEPKGLRGYTPLLKDVMQICGNLKCPVSRVMTFEGYEILARYEGREAVPGDIYTGRISYRPLRSMLYDFFGYQEWKDALKRCFDLIEDGKERRAMTEEEKTQWRKRFGENGTPPEMKDPYESERARVLKDKAIDLKTLYCICKVLRCTPDCVVEYR